MLGRYGRQGRTLAPPGYESIKASSEADFTEDLKKVDEALEEFGPTVSQFARASLALSAARSSNVAKRATAARSSASVGAISCCWEKSSSRVEREHPIVVPK